MKILLSLLLSVSTFASARGLVNIESFPGKVVVKIDPQMTGSTGALDVLFVVDDSASMQNHQANLAHGAQFLVEELAAKNVDYHAAVTSTSMTGNGVGTNAVAGAIVTPFVTQDTPNAVSVLSSQMILGINGDAQEEMLRPVMLALSEPMLSNRNLGFYREGADLAVVFVTDAEDQGRDNTSDFTKFLKGLKTNGQKIVLQALMVPSGDTNCTRDSADLPLRLESVLADFKGSAYSLCDAHFVDNMRSIGRSLAPRAGNNTLKPGTDVSHIVLPSVPEFDSIKVTYGKQVIRAGSTLKGWIYDEATNEVRIGTGVVWETQPAGATIDIEYVPADWK